MRNYNRITPEGTKDLLLEECLVRRETEEKIRSVFQSQGYDELEHRDWNFLMFFSRKPFSIRKNSYIN